MEGPKNIPKLHPEKKLRGDSPMAALCRHYLHTWSCSGDTLANSCPCKSLLARLQGCMWRRQIKRAPPPGGRTVRLLFRPLPAPGRLRRAGAAAQAAAPCPAGPQRVVVGAGPFSSTLKPEDRCSTGMETGEIRGRGNRGGKAGENSVLFSNCAGGLRKNSRGVVTGHRKPVFRGPWPGFQRK